jgi:MGT family glycosyltransferase
MPTALFLGLPLHGHTNPTLPLVAELVARGHTVVYYATEPFAESITRAGASYRPYRNTHLNHTAGIPARMDELAYLLTRTASEILDDELNGMREVCADYVITDAAAPWGHWVGEALGVPVLTSVTTFAFNRQVLGYGLSRGARPKSAAFLWSKIRHLVRAVLLQRAMRRRHRLKGPAAVTAMFGRTGLNIIYTSRFFQPCVETFDDRFVFIGPSVTRTEVGTLEWPDGDALSCMSRSGRSFTTTRRSIAPALTRFAASRIARSSRLAPRYRSIASGHRHRTCRFTRVCRSCRCSRMRPPS